ncbi:MAG TPA: hypothetical protein VFG59_19125 [Anaeromyxobacter sp.]|nr:hypothetical protein [Anaeromyxobacter sp.]
MHPARLLEAVAAALLCALCCPVRAEEPAPGAGGALVISADPPRLVLGRDPGAELRIAAPAEVQELSVTASVGKVEGVRRMPGGGFAARYKAPAERFPQVAIVAAVGRGAAGPLDGWVAVPLAGQGDARVRGEPGSEVSLRIGDQSFGPERVGVDGVAVIPVVVPPGVREGHRGFESVELKVPDTALIHAAAERSTVLADRAETLRFFVYVVAPHGAARRDEPPVLEATRGAVTLKPREPGAYQGTWTLPSGPPGEERLTVRLEGYAASRAVIRVAVVPGPPATVALALDRTTLRAGEGGEIQIAARALDGAGNPTPSPVMVSVDAGLLEQDNVEPGAVRARLRIDPRFFGKDQVTVRARAAATGVTAVQPVSLISAGASRAVLSPARILARADGRAEVVLRLSLWDRFGNPANGAPAVGATVGPTPRLELLQPGEWALHYRGDPVAVPTPARVSAELGAASASSDLLLLPAPSAQTAFLASAGALALLSAHSFGGQFLAAVELPLPEVIPLRADQALGFRLELMGLGASREVAAGREAGWGAALLAGPVLKGLLPGARWFASSTLGVMVGEAHPPDRSARGGAALAARLALGVAMPVGRSAPYLELGFLGAGRTPMGAFGALTLSLGARFDGVRRTPGGAEE